MRRTINHDPLPWANHHYEMVSPLSDIEKSLGSLRCLIGIFGLCCRAQGFFAVPLDPPGRVFVDGSLPIPCLPHSEPPSRHNSQSHATRTKKLCAQPVFAGTILRKGGAQRRVVHLGSQAVTIPGLLTLNSHWSARALFLLFDWCGSLPISIRYIPWDIRVPGSTRTRR